MQDRLCSNCRSNKQKLYKSDDFEMPFWCLQFPPKNERKHVDLRFHSSKVEFVCSFFGGNIYFKKSFQLFLTIIDFKLLNMQQCISKHFKVRIGCLIWVSGGMICLFLIKKKHVKLRSFKPETVLFETVLEPKYLQLPLRQ